MKQWLFLFVTVFYGFHTLAQTNNGIRLIGHLYDAQSKEYLSGASVVCLLAKDSSMIQMIFTDSNGAFGLDSLSQEKYYLYITYIGYNALLKPVDLRANGKVVDLGDLSMERKSLTLAKVDVIGTRPPVKILKDTIEFNAGSYKLREHSALEELLKRLPGVQVDESGGIRVNGEVVSIILVDGRPFFSRDPSIASKNLQADMIEKVQIIDRKIKERDPAIFDSERTEKVINITLKKSSKNIWSGELMLGHGIDNRFAARTNIARFSDLEQFALLVNGDNINGNMEGIDPGNGLSRKWNPNLSYTKDINDRISYTGSYSMQDSKNEDRRGSSQEIFGVDSSYFYDQRSVHLSRGNSNAINSQLSLKTGPLLTIIYSNSLGYSISKDELLNEHGSYGNHRQLLDSGMIENYSSKSLLDISNQITIDKKFRRSGYNLNLSLSYSSANKREDIYNASNTLYVQPDDKYILDTLNQYSKIADKGKFLQFMITQIFPAFRSGKLSLSYSFTNSTSLYSKITYDFDPFENHYDNVIDTLTGSFKNAMTGNLFRIGIESKSERIDYKISFYAMAFDLTNFNLLLGNSLKYGTITVIPRGSLNYKFDNSRRLRVLLTGNPILPNAEQLRPIPDNSNPLVIKQGNGGLKAGSMHALSLNYSSFNASRMLFFNWGFNSSFMFNQIIDEIWLDSLKRQIIRPLNISGSYDLQMSSDYSFPIGRYGSSFNAGTSVRLSRDMSYVNDVKGSNMNLSLSQSISYNYAYKELLNVYVTGSCSYNRATYANSSFVATNFFGYGFSFRGTFKLPLDLLIGSSINYTLNTGRFNGYNSSVCMMNAYISKTVFGNRKGMIRLQGFDILNQNVSISRNVGPSYIEDVKVDVLQRSFMLSFTYYLKQQRASK
ncbi:hypothetical protein QFZ51_005440 [Chitinophaga sp. W3I9]|uniref:outer membrane beta-barrel protein n=1 Tax=Chitinophaga sp. W3I9 TaxID=3373924 RepID=UPI003D25ABD4